MENAELIKMMTSLRKKVDKETKFLKNRINFLTNDLCYFRKVEYVDIHNNKIFISLIKHEPKKGDLMRFIPTTTSGELNKYLTNHLNVQPHELEEVIHNERPGSGFTFLVQEVIVEYTSTEQIDYEGWSDDEITLIVKLQYYEIVDRKVLTETFKPLRLDE